MKNFWSAYAKASADKEKLNKPLYALAPLAGVADSAFRQICKKFGADVVYSEMVSASGLAMNSKKTHELLKFDKVERPYVIQLFGSDPRQFALAAKIISDKKPPSGCKSHSVAWPPDGIDINFGCPVPKVVKQGAGIALFADLKKSRSITKCVIEATDLPVSIKTRSRVGQIDILRFLDNIQDLNVKAVMIHGRAGSEGFSGPVDTGIIKQARNYFGGIILANGGVGINLTPGPSPSPSISALQSGRQAGKQERGDVKEYADWLLRETEADGIGIAQGSLGRPWIFKAVRTGQSVNRSWRAIRKVAIEHAILAVDLKGDQGVIEMRKHLSWYVKGMPGARSFREKAVQVSTINDIRGLLTGRKYFDNNI